MAQFTVDLVAKVAGTSKVKALTSSTDKLNAAVKKTQSSSDKLEKAFNGVNSSAGQAANGINKTGRAADKASGNVQKLAGGFGLLKVAVAGLALGFVAKQLIDITSAAIQSTGEITKLEAAFASLTGSKEAAADLRNELFQLSKTTPFPNDDLQTAARRFLAVGIEAENVSGTINRVGSLAAQSGQDLNRLGLIYAQIYAKQRLTGEENLQLLEANIDLSSELAQVTGLSGEALRDAMSKGEVGIDKVNDAIKLATGEMTVLDLAAKAVNVQMDNIGDNVQQVSLGFSGALAPAFGAVFGVINEAFDLLFPSLESVQDKFKPILEQSERFADLLEGNPELVDAIAQTFESLIDFGISPALTGLENINEELEQNPQGLINTIYDIEFAIRQALSTASALVQTLGVVAKFTGAGVIARTDAQAGFDLAKEAFSDLVGLGDAYGAIDELERLKPRPVQPRAPRQPRNGNLQGRQDGSDSGGSKGGSSGGRSAAAAAAKAEREAQRLQEQLEKQFATSEKLRINADNRLLVAKAITEADRIALEGMVKKDEIERKYAELSGKSLSDAETKNLLAAKGLETDLATLETNKALADLKEGALEGIVQENELLQSKLDGTQKEYELRKKIADLVKASGGTIAESEAAAIVERNAALKEQVAILDDNKARATELAGAISGELGGAFKSIIEGTKTTEEAFSDMFQGIASKFLDMAMKILQDAITQQLVSLFGNLLGGGLSGAGGGGSLPGFADGGRPEPNKLSIVGEEGPELFVPDRAGTIIPNDAFDDARNAMGSSSDESAAFAENEASLSTTNNFYAAREREEAMAEQFTNREPIRLEVDSVNIGGMDVVSMAQFQAGMEATAKKAEAKVFRDLKNKPARRAQIGMR